MLKSYFESQEYFEGFDIGYIFGFCFENGRKVNDALDSRLSILI